MRHAERMQCDQMLSLFYSHPPSARPHSAILSCWRNHAKQMLTHRRRQGIPTRARKEMEREEEGVRACRSEARSVDMGIFVWS
jgi:hypothetical protein